MDVYCLGPVRPAGCLNVGKLMSVNVTAGEKTVTMLLKL